MSSTLQGPAGATLAPRHRAVPRAVAAVIVLTAIVVGAPLLLVRLGHALPIDSDILRPSALLHPDDGGLLLLLLLAVGWLSWSVIVLCVVVEVWAALRCAPTPRLPGLGGPQRLAAMLVASLTVLGGAGGVPSLASEAGSGPAEPALQAVRVLMAQSGSTPGASPVDPAAVLPGDNHEARGRAQAGDSPDRATGRSGQADLPTITTQRHDTLWLLAERHLGSGERFAEIVALNTGVAQPDGRALAADGRLYPGWTLRLPPDAVLERAGGERHRVERGDTLWQIADDSLGDPTRYPEIFQANAGDLQPDGRRLTDPDLILPGWVLELPTGSKDDRPDDPASDQTAVGGVSNEEVRPGSAAPVAEPEADDGPAPIDDALGEDRSADDDALGDVPAADDDALGEDRPADDDARGDEPARDDEGAPADGSAEDDPAPGGSDTRAPKGVPLDRAPADGLPLDRAPDSQLPLDRAPDSQLPLDRAPDSQLPLDRAPDDGPRSGAGDPQGTARDVPAPSAPAPATGTGTRGQPPEGPPVPDRAAAQAPAAAFLVPAGGTVAALLLVGLAREVARRRRQFQRYRRPGEQMSPPSAGGRDVEDVARAAAEETGPDLLERALGQLAEHARQAGIGMPRVRVVRVTPTGIRLELGQPATTALPPFRVEGDRQWVLDPELLQPELSEVARALPGLVTVGVVGDETILVDVSEVGTLRIEGATESVPGVLRALASELALGPAREATSRTLCLTDLALSEAIVAAMEAGELAVDRDVGRVAATLAAALRAGAPDPRDDDPLELVLCDRPLPVPVPGRSGAALITTDPAAAAGAVLDLDGHGAAVLRPDGVALVPQSLSASATTHLTGLLAATHLPTDPHDAADLVAPTDPGPAVIDLRAAAVAVPGEPGAAIDSVHRDRDGIEPPALEEVVPAPGARTAPTGPTVRTALTAQTAPAVPTAPAAPPAPAAPTGQTAPTALAVPTAPVAQTAPATLAVPAAPASVAAPSVLASDVALVPAGGLRDQLATPSAPRVLLLGEVRVVGADGQVDSTRVGRLAETAAFVLLNPDARPSELQSALWPSRRSNPQTCRQMISRARTWLGRTDDGDPYLMPFSQTGGRLRMRPEVGSDWADFQHLAALGLADPDDTEHLAQALRLVRGRPFGAVAARELPWADLHVNEMISLVTDVAHALALRHERAGRWSAARDAALRGLLTQSESEVLEQVVARVARVP